jgi:hypothetical protein
MKLSPIVLLLRSANTEFGTEIAGAAEFSTIQKDTLEVNTAYVIQTDDNATPNTIQGTVEQKIVEGFGVVVAVKNDESQADKTGLTAYDQLHLIRKQFWDVLVGLNLDSELNDDGYTVEGPVEYKGGSLIDINAAWLWYLYEFQYPATLQEIVKDYNLDDLNTISAQWVMTPNVQIPVTGAEPLPDAIENADMESIIDLTENLLAGAFDGRAFDSGFDLYEG